MRIEELRIKSFGGLKDKVISFSPSANVIYGENESGKSTVAAFIKFIFYGVSAKSTIGEIKERDRYLPFDSADCGGSLIVDIGGRRCQIERFMAVGGKKKETVREEVSVVDLITGETVTTDKDLGEYFFGVSEKVFLETAFFGQLSDTSFSSGDMSTAMGNILFSGSEQIDAAKATKKLDELRVGLLHKNEKGGRIFQLRERERELCGLLSSAKEDNIKRIECEGNIARISSTLDEKIKEEAAAEKRAEAAKLYNAKRLFDMIKREEDKKKDRENILRVISPSGTPFPSDRIESAKDIVKRIKEQNSAIAETERVLAVETKEIEEKQPREQERSAIDALGGELKAGELFSSLINGGKTKTAVGAVLLAVAVISALLSFFIPFGKYVLMAAIALLLISVIFFALGNGNRKEAKNLARIFGDIRPSEFFACLGGYSRKKTECEALVLARRNTEEKLSREKAMLEVLYKEEYRAVALLSEVSGMPLGNSLEETVEAAENANIRIRELLADIASINATMSAYSDQLSGKKEEDVISALKATGVEDPSVLNEQEENAALNFYRNQKNTLQERLYQLKVEETRLKANTLDSVALTAELFDVREEKKKREKQYRACSLAIDALADAGGKLREGVSPRISEYACSLMSKATGGKYSNITVSPALGTGIEIDGAIKSLEYLSAGTRDLAYISLRFALIDLLYLREKPPVVFDESFAHQDARRTAEAMSLLEELGKEGLQTLLLTCKKEEPEIAKNKGINVINMSDN